MTRVHTWAHNTASDPAGPVSASNRPAASAPLDPAGTGVQADSRDAPTPMADTF